MTRVIRPPGPTSRNELGFKSANAAEEHLKALARKGAIEMVAGASRGIRLPDSEGIPVVGRVAAGSRCWPRSISRITATCPASFFKPAADYFLRVTGDSMIDIGIFDEDLLAVHRTTDVHDGDIVVARIDDEVTVKRLKRGKDKQFLQLLPENADYEPIVVDLQAQDFAIEGISVGVLRSS